MFSQTTEYALRAMAWLAAHEGVLTPSPTLASSTRVPANYLSKVLQQLATAHLIVGRRGVGGGYRLARPAEQITLLEVVRCIREVERPGGPHVPEEDSLCPLHEAKHRAAAAVFEILGRLSLRDVQHGAEPHLCHVCTETRFRGPDHPS